MKNLNQAIFHKAGILKLNLIAVSVAMFSLTTVEAKSDCPGVPSPDYQLIRTAEEFLNLPSVVMPSGRRVVQPPAGLPVARFFLCNNIRISSAPTWNSFDRVSFISNGSEITIATDLQRPLIERMVGDYASSLKNISFNFSVPSNMTCTKASPCNTQINYLNTNVHGLLIGINGGVLVENIKVRGTLNVNLVNEDPFSGSMNNFIGGVVGEAGGRYRNILNLVNLNIHYRRAPIVEPASAPIVIDDTFVVYNPNVRNDLLWAGGFAGLVSSGALDPNNPGDAKFYQVANKGDVNVHLEHYPRHPIPEGYLEFPGIVAAVGGIAGGMQAMIADSYSSGRLSLIRNFNDSPFYLRSRSVIAGLVGRTPAGFSIDYHNRFSIVRSYSKSAISHHITEGEQSEGDAWGLIGNRAVYPNADYESRIIDSYSASDVHESQVYEYPSVDRELSQLMNPSENEYVNWDFMNIWARDAGQTARLQTESQWPTDLAICIPDFDDNRVVNVSDMSAFLSAYFNGDMRADLDGSGLLSTPDIFAFLSALFPLLNQACPE